MVVVKTVEYVTSMLPLLPAQELVSIGIELLVKSILLLSLAGGLSLVLRRSSATWRHVVWVLALIGVLALPCLEPLLPHWGAAWKVYLPDDVKEVFMPAGPTQAEGDSVEAVSEPTGGDVEAGGPLLNENKTSIEEVQTLEAPQGKSGLAIWMVGLWAMGLVLILVRLGIGLVGLWWVGQHCERLEDEAWSQSLEEACKTLHLRRSPRLLISRQVATPMTWGLLRPVIVLPEGAQEWAEGQRRMVLAHELAHVQRRDVLWYLIAQIACALYWVNPLVWIAAHRLRIVAEYACDDLVLRGGANRRAYAQSLVEAGRLYHAAWQSGYPAIGMARSELEGRLLAILDAGRCRTAVSSIGLQAALFLALCVVVPLAGFRPADSSQADSLPVGALSPGPAGTLEGPVGLCEQDRWVSSIRTDSAATEQFIVQLRSGDAQRRREATNGLGNVGTPQAVPVLITALADPSEQVRQGAAYALGNLGDQRAVASLINALADPNGHVQLAAVGALGALSAEAATRPLLALMGHPDEHLRQGTAYALGDIGDPRAVATLISALQDPNKHVRQAASTALGRLDDMRATQPLIDMMGDPEPHVRAAAIRALGQLGARTTAERIAQRYETSPDPYERLEAARALGRFGDFRGVGLLVTMLKDESEQFIRRDAAWALGAIASTSGALRERLREAPYVVEAALREAVREESIFVHYAAACSLGRIGGTGSEDALRRLQQDPDTAEEARNAASWALLQIASN